MSIHLYHYYDAEIGPFRNLSGLSSEEANRVSQQLRQEVGAFASKRSEDYLSIRKELETKARNLFIAKGGRPRNAYPHYMTLGKCDWLMTWYKNPACLAIDWKAFAEDSISFSYGDLFPTMRYEDDRPYRKQIYTRAEIITVVDEFGWPQDWNSRGDQGPERYIEVQIWDEEVIKPYRKR